MTPAQSAAGPGYVVGFIDIGTYSVRLMVVRINPNGSYTVLDEQRESVRLGGNEFIERSLQKDAMDRAVLVCGKFAEVARQLQAEEIVTVATAATREARNQSEFVERLNKAGLEPVHVISGKEEARLIYLGVSRHMDMAGRLGVFIDIGGGSTEVSVGNAETYQYLDSMKLGSIRVSQRFGIDKLTGPLPESLISDVCRYVKDQAIRTVQRVQQLGPTLAVGSSGTICNLAEIAAASQPKGGPLDGTMLPRVELQRVIEMLRQMPLKQRRAAPGINPDRADIIIGGACVLLTLMTELNLEAVQTSKRGVRDGMLIDHLANSVHHHADAVHSMTARERSVTLLGRQCGFDEKHAKRVSALAVMLFDESRRIGLHTYGQAERELVAHAALLHDIGLFLSFVNHQNHSYYLIRHADLVGFDQMEICTMAALARYHRKGAPKGGHPEMEPLDKPHRSMVKRLYAIMRLAESLDRSHTDAVQRVVLNRPEKDRVTMALVTQGDATLERWAIDKHVKAFKKAFGCELMLLPGTATVPLEAITA